MDACIATHREISAGSAEIFMPLKIQAENVGKLEKSENYEFFMMNIVEPRLCEFLLADLALLRCLFG